MNNSISLRLSLTIPVFFSSALAYGGGENCIIRFYCVGNIACNPEVCTDLRDARTHCRVEAATNQLRGIYSTGVVSLDQGLNEINIPTNLSGTCPPVPLLKCSEEPQDDIQRYVCVGINQINEPIFP